jgi:hypothetical protein
MVAAKDKLPADAIIPEETNDVSETPDEIDATEMKNLRLIEAGVPEPVVRGQIPSWKQRYGAVQVAYLSSGVYIYRKLTWADMKAISNSLSNMAKNPNVPNIEAALRMADVELQLEKVVLYPQINAQNAGQFPSGDLEALQALINQFSGYDEIMPQIEDF